MTKKEIQKRVLQNGEPLSSDKFEWDEKTNTFSSSEDNLVLDFNNIDYCTFRTGSDCTFKTGSGCIFKTGSFCTFDTGYDCTFNTGSSCTFDTSAVCTFRTGFGCVVVRRDIYEVIELKEGQKIKLNKAGIKGFEVIEDEDETVDIRISKKSLQALKDSGITIINLLTIKHYD